MSSYQRGLRAEYWSIIYLWCKGYRLLARRYKTRLGEVDLVMRRGGMLVFIEVKARPDMASGIDAIMPKSRERIQRAAMLFCQAYPKYQNHAMRFDALVVRPRRLPYHITDAWRP